MSDDEELIGDTIFGGAPYYQSTTGGQRARYLILMGGDSIYYRPAGYHPWGWFTTAMGHQDCSSGHHERHDVTGTGLVDTTATERHCVGNGEFAVTVDTLQWNGAGTTIVARGTLFRRTVAMLGTLGAFDGSSGDYADVHVALDRATPTGFSLSGDLRAGGYFLTGTDMQLFPAGHLFTIAAGDMLWFQASYLGTGSPTQPWYGNTKAILTQFNFDHFYFPGNFHGGVNSSPAVETNSALWTFPSRTEPFRVVGRVVAPFHLGMDSGIVRLADSIHVTTVTVSACFGVTGYRVEGQTLTFDGHCSSGRDTLEYRWTFGDGGTVEWTRDSVVAHHGYATSGTYSARLRVRRVHSTAPVDSSTRSLTIVGPLWVVIDGPALIDSAGIYTWTSEPHDGAPPYGTYRWYYQEEGGSESLDGTSSTYSRWVTARRTYSFRLRHTVQDAISTEAENELWVDVIHRSRNGAVGLLDAAGTCKALPAEATARNEAHAVIARTGRWPVPCLVSAP